MSQPSYLQQIAQRNSGSFSQLMPPRSLFQNWETPLPLEISDESPSVSAQIERSPVLPVPPASQTTLLAEPPIQPQDATLVPPPRLDLPKTSQAERSPEIPPATTIPTESLANPPILPGTTLDSSPPSLSPTDPARSKPERATLETSPNPEATEPRNSSSLGSESLTAIAPKALQPLEPGLPSEQKSDVTENTSPPPPRTIAAASSNNHLIERGDRAQLIERGDRAQSPTDNRPPTESPPLVRWLTPTVQDSAVEKPSPPATSERKISSEAKDSPIPLVAREQSPQGNTVRIGTIDIQIVPPPVVPQPAPTNALSRGFASSFGLRQG